MGSTGLHPQTRALCCAGQVVWVLPSLQPVSPSEASQQLPEAAEQLLTQVQQRLQPFAQYDAKAQVAHVTLYVHLKHMTPSRVACLCRPSSCCHSCAPASATMASVCSWIVQMQASCRPSASKVHAQVAAGRAAPSHPKGGVWVFWRHLPLVWTAVQESLSSTALAS